MSKEEDFSIFADKQPNPNTEIWIAENVCIDCNAKYNWWTKFWVKLLLGWKIKSKYDQSN